MAEQGRQDKAGTRLVDEEGTRPQKKGTRPRW